MTTISRLEILKALPHLSRDEIAHTVARHDPFDALELARDIIQAAQIVISAERKAP
jgi:hypothetical protein